MDLEGIKHKTANDICENMLRNVMFNITNRKYVDMCDNPNPSNYREYKEKFSFNYTNFGQTKMFIDRLDDDTGSLNELMLSTRIIDTCIYIINKKMFSSRRKCIRFFNKFVKPYIKVNEKHVRENNIVHLDIDAILDPFVTAYQQFVISDNMKKVVDTCGEKIHKKLFKSIDYKHGIGIEIKDSKFKNTVSNLQDYIVEYFNGSSLTSESISNLIDDLCKTFTKLFFSMVYVKFVNFCLCNAKQLDPELCYIANDIEIFYTKNVRNLWYNYDYFNNLHNKLCLEDSVLDTLKVINKEYKLWVGKYPEFKLFDITFFNGVASESRCEVIANNEIELKKIKEVLNNVSEKIMSQIRNSFEFNLSDAFKDWLTRNESIILKPKMFNILNSQDKRFNVK